MTIHMSAFVICLEADFTAMLRKASQRHCLDLRFLLEKPDPNPRVKILSKFNK